MALSSYLLKEGPVFQVALAVIYALNLVPTTVPKEFDLCKVLGALAQTSKSLALLVETHVVITQFNEIWPKVYPHLNIAFYAVYDAIHDGSSSVAKFLGHIVHAVISVFAHVFGSSVDGVKHVVATIAALFSGLPDVITKYSPSAILISLVALAIQKSFF